MLCWREISSQQTHAALLWRFAPVEGCPECPQQSGHRDVSLASLQLRNEEDLLGFSIKVSQQFPGLTVLAEVDCAKALQSKIAEAHFGACNLSYVVGIELMSSIASAVHDDLDVHEGLRLSCERYISNARAQLAFRGVLLIVVGPCEWFSRAMTAPSLEGAPGRRSLAIHRKTCQRSMASTSPCILIPIAARAFSCARPSGSRSFWPSAFRRADRFVGLAPP